MLLPVWDGYLWFLEVFVFRHYWLAYLLVASLVFPATFAAVAVGGSLRAGIAGRTLVSRMLTLRNLRALGVASAYGLVGRVGLALNDYVAFVFWPAHGGSATLLFIPDLGLSLTLDAQ